MTYNEKKSLYESIMKEVAKIVKRNLNESYNHNNETIKYIKDKISEISKTTNNRYFLYISGSPDLCYGDIYNNGSIELNDTPSLPYNHIDDTFFDGSVKFGTEAQKLFNKYENLPNYERYYICCVEEPDEEKCILFVFLTKEAGEYLTKLSTERYEKKRNLYFKKDPLDPENLHNRISNREYTAREMRMTPEERQKREERERRFNNMFKDDREKTI